MTTVCVVIFSALSLVAGGGLQYFIVIFDLFSTLIQN